MATEATIPKLLTAKEVSDILTCSPDHVVHLYRTGQLPAVPIATTPPRAGRPGPRMLRFRPGDVRAYIESQATVMEQPVPEAGRAAGVILLAVGRIAC